MFLGPVFRAELLRTSRQRRYYVLRVVYGLVLLFLMWMQYLSLLSFHEARPGGLLHDDLSRFATESFRAFAVLQMVTILFLVPDLFGGVIADEKQRKTIHYLMASRLSSADIVLDKLAGRLVHVAFFVLIGLPVVALLSLFGGISWDYLAIAYLGTCSTTFFAATLATLVSTLSRRVRQAVLVAYIVELAWLFVPTIAAPACKFAFPKTYVWFGPVNDWLLSLSPMGVYSRMRLGSLPFRTPAVFREEFFWMVGLQLVGGLLFLLVATLGLRPIFRRQADGGERVQWFGARRRRPRWLARPPCGDDAMLWKERHFARTDIFTKLVVLPATVLLTVFLILVSGVDEHVRLSFLDLIHGVYGSGSAAAETLGRGLRLVSPWYVGLWLLAVAGASASGIGVERDQDTWTSLVSTPLSGGEILLGKRAGAVWGLRGFGGLIGLAWLLGLALGAVHPLGLFLALSVVGLSTWFVASLGTYFSLTSRTTARALSKALAILIFLNGGYLLIVLPLYEIAGGRRAPRYENELIVGCTPLLAAFSLLSYQGVNDLFEGMTHLEKVDPETIRPVLLAILLLLGYAWAALLLTRRAVSRFDRLIDRPRREVPP